MRSEINPWRFALVDLDSARYSHRSGDPWNSFNTELHPRKADLLEIIRARGYTDEERADYILELLKRLTD